MTPEWIEALADQIVAHFNMIHSIPEFKPFAKIPRLFREMCITEKIDGSNAIVHITDEGRIFAGSRNRWITPEADNYGFARWVNEHQGQLIGLGPGSHFGEWWGSGIGRGYGLDPGFRRFSLFNVCRWHEAGLEPVIWPTGDPRKVNTTLPAPECCRVVPILFGGVFNTETVRKVMESLHKVGSCAQPGFMNPEGVVVLHRQSGHLFKMTIEHDEQGKDAV